MRRKLPISDKHTNILTPSELRITDDIALGFNPAQIAVRRGLAYETVRNYLKAVFGKTETNTQTQLAIFWLTGTRPWL